MKRNLFLLGLLVFMFVFASCKQEKTEKENEEKENTEEVVTDQNENSDDGKTSDGIKKYDIKSGVITQKSEVMGMIQDIVITFDDYGAKEVTDVYNDFMGVKNHSRTLVVDGYMYSLAMGEKTGTKMKIMGTNTGSSYDFKNMSEEMKEDMNIKVVGKETFLGKECEKITMDYVDMSTSGTFLIWNGIALKSDVIAMGMQVVIETVSIDENAKIDETLFEIPADFQITEM